jgi:hypothetical protein
MADRSQVFEEAFAALERAERWVYEHEDKDCLANAAAIATARADLARQLDTLKAGRDWQYEKAVEWRNRCVTAEAERDRYREALEQIADEQLRDDLKFDHEIARAALHPKERDE